MQPLLHSQQPLRLLLQHTANRDAGPLGNQPGDVLLVHHHVNLVVLEPPLAVRVVLVVQAHALRPQLRRALVVRSLGCGLLLVLKLPDAVSLLLDLLGQALGVDSQLACGLVYEVNSLVRQVALGDVAMAQLHRRRKSGLLYLHLVVGLVAGAKPSQHLYGGVHVRLLNEDGLEPALQRAVLLDVLAVLVNGGRAYALELPAGQRRLQQVAGVQRALSRACPDHGVDLVDEQDDLAMRLLHLVHDALEALLELAPELAACHHAAHVQGQQPAALERLRDVPGHNTLGKPLGDGRLPHAGVAYDGRVVLCTAGEGLHDPLDLRVPAYNGIQLAITGQGSQVYAVPLQGAVAALGLLVGDPVAAPDDLQGVVDLLLVHAVLPEDCRRVSPALQRDGDEQVLRADELVIQPVRFGLGVCQQRKRPGRGIYLRYIGHLWAAFQRLFHPSLHPFHVHPHLAQRLHRHAVLQLQQRQQDVLHVPLAVAVSPHNFLGLGQGFVALFRKVLWS